MTNISPSLLSVDFFRFDQALALLQQHGVSQVHIDVMDGHFVPNLSFGAEMARALHRHYVMRSEAHLMVESPESFVPRFLDAGATEISVHLESTRHPSRLLQTIRGGGALAGLALNPATPLESLRYLWGSFDFLLLMSVDPGFGGQVFLPTVWEKIEQARLEIDGRRLPVRLEVDGGVGLDNAGELVKRGVDTLVVGAAIFAQRDPEASLRDLMDLLTKVSHQKEENER
ncbi:MAG: ribulose-phosphate 3-epimerase [Coprothermobacterota bacterium]|nr:ribulose-phosphate 3-epimerase [Coprothermobacterota bacterium]